MPLCPTSGPQLSAAVAESKLSASSPTTVWLVALDAAIAELRDAMGAAGNATSAALGVPLVLAIEDAQVALDDATNTARRWRAWVAAGEPGDPPSGCLGRTRIAARRRAQMCRALARAAAN